MSDFETTVARLYADWNYDSPRLIYSFLRCLKPDVHVDCGTYRGLSAAWAGRALQENNKGRVVCLDDFSLREHVDRYGDPRTHLEANLRQCGVSEWIEIREGKTNEVEWPNQIQSCYVDAFHSYKCACHDVAKAVERGATMIFMDDTENCVGPRMLADDLRVKMSDRWDFMEIHSDNGLLIMTKRQERRLITFSQELPNNPGVDLRNLTLEQQGQHFAEASAITGLDYFPLIGSTEHV